MVRSSTPWLPRGFLTIVVENKTKGTAPNLFPEVEQMSCTLTQIASVLQPTYRQDPCILHSK
jgi:hypothetical protein